MEQSATPKEMCETILEAIKKHDPTCTLTPKEIWEYSPTGEVCGVVDAYFWALDVLGIARISGVKDDGTIVWEKLKNNPRPSKPH